jgi:hypothetical protein
LHFFNSTHPNKDVSALFTLGELQSYAYHTKLKFA